MLSSDGCNLSNSDKDFRAAADPLEDAWRTFRAQYVKAMGQFYLTALNMHVQVARNCIHSEEDVSLSFRIKLKLTPLHRMLSSTRCRDPGLGCENSKQSLRRAA